MKKKWSFLLAVLPVAAVQREKRNYTSFRAPKGSLDLVWRGWSATHAKPVT
jgi:hypothetical protein